MSLLDKATIITTPTAHSNGVLHSIKGGSVADFDVVRGSAATRVNAEGLIEDIATNIPRIDYTGGGCPSLLLEPQSTNLLTYSEDFSDASWVKSGAIITSNSTISADGSLNASLLKGDGLSSFPRIQTTVSGSGQISFSVFVKKELSDDVIIYLSGTGIGGGAEASSVYKYTFSTDSFLIISGGTINSSKSTSFGNDWVRLTLNYTTTTITGVRIYPKYASTSTDGVYIWGAQLEALPYSTSYIPTSGAIATRLADSVTGAGDATTFNSTEGVLYAEIAALADDLTASRKISLNNGTSNNQVTISYDSGASNRIKSIIFNGGVISSLQHIVADVNQVTKVAFKYKSNDCSLWVNGVKVDTNTNSFSGLNLSKLSFNNGGAANPFQGKVKSVITFDTALTDAELECLTTI